MTTLKNYDRQETEYFTTTRVSDRIVTEQEVRKPFHYRRRNYLTTSFIAPASTEYNQNYGTYSLQFNTPQPCQPCNQPAPQPQMMPIMIPFPYPQQQQKDCHCEEEDSFKEEVIFLRSRVAELLSREPEVKYVKETIQDTAKVQELELENQRLRLNLGQEQSKLRGKEEENYDLKQRLLRLENSGDSQSAELKRKIQDYESQLYSMRQELERVQALLRQKQQEAEDWQLKFEEMQSHGFIEIEETVTKLTSEVDVWRNRFKKLNTEFFQTQEQLIMVEAELDSIKNGGVKEVKEVKVERKVNQTSYQGNMSSRIEVSAPIGGARGSRVIETSDSFQREGNAQRIYP